MIFFDVIRRELAAKGFSKALIDNLEAIATEAADTSSSVPADLTALQAAVAQLQTDLIAAQQAADDAPLLVPIKTLSPEQILAITDDALLTEDGDYFLTETGDRLLMEA